MNLKPRRIAYLLKELESAAIITIVSRAKEGLSNLYRLLRVAQPKGGPNPPSSKTADGVAKKDIPGKQRNAGEGMQEFADESHAFEIHALNTHTHIQPAPAKKIQTPTKIEVDQPNQVVCDSRNSGEEGSEKSTELMFGGEAASLHIPSPRTVIEKVITVLTEFGVSEVRAKQLAATVFRANLDDEYVKGLVAWVEGQSASRAIYNPAGLLVQMVHQLVPMPQAKGAGVPTLNGLQLDFEQKKKFVEEQLPQIIAIEERNLREARFEKDKPRIKARLDMLLAQQAKEGRNLAQGTAYLADRGIEVS